MIDGFMQKYFDGNAVDIVLLLMFDESVHAIKNQYLVIVVHPVPLISFVMSADQFFQHQ